MDILCVYALKTKINFFLSLIFYINCIINNIDTTFFSHNYYLSIVNLIIFFHDASNPYRSVNFR